MTPCECKLAGYCKRHKVYKQDRQLALCQTSQDHFELWERHSKRKVGSTAVTEDKKKEIGRAAWVALHTEKNPSMDWLLNVWLLLVPAFECQCQKFAKEWIAANPPPLDENFFEWTWKFHDAVDQKTGDQRMTLEEATRFWQEARPE